MLCNMDRICMSIAILPMAKELGWQPGMMGVIQSSFLWGYLSTQLIGGRLADQLGGKIVMAFGIVWFSLASMILPAALQPAAIAAGLALPLTLFSRAMVGLGEGVALPAMNNLVARHVDPSRKASALGACFAGFHSGNLLGLLLSPIIVSTYGWRAVFFMYGVLGLPILLHWMRTVPEQPKRAEDVSSATSSSEAQRQVPLKEFLSNSAVWAIIIVNFVNHWGYFIYLNWLPTFFSMSMGLDIRSSSLFSFLPWLVMAFGRCGAREALIKFLDSSRLRSQIVIHSHFPLASSLYSSMAGILADTLVAKGRPVLWVRKLVQTIAFIGPAFALLFLGGVLPLPPGVTMTPTVAMLLFTAALGTTSLGQAGFVANMSDVAPKQAGQMFGLANTFGSAAGILGVSATGFLVEMTGRFDAVFLLTSAMYVVGTIVWHIWCRTDAQFK